MGLEERERQGRAGGLAARIPPAPPGPGACEVPHVAHRASHIAARARGGGGGQAEGGGGGGKRL